MPGKFFLQNFEKWENVIFGPHFQASRASPAQKSRGLRVVLSQKLFNGYIFFWATQLVNIFWVPMKQIRRKSAMCYCIRPKPSDFIIISLRYGRAKLHWRRIQRCNLGGPAQWWRLWMVSRGPSIYYVSIWTGWVGSENCHFCWHSVHTVILPDWTLKKWGLSNFAFQHC